MCCLWAACSFCSRAPHGGGVQQDTPMVGYVAPPVLSSVVYAAVSASASAAHVDSVDRAWKCCCSLRRSWFGAGSRGSLSRGGGELQGYHRAVLGQYRTLPAISQLRAVGASGRVIIPIGTTLRVKVATLLLERREHGSLWKHAGAKREVVEFEALRDAGLIPG